MVKSQKCWKIREVNPQKLPKMEQKYFSSKIDTPYRNNDELRLKTAYFDLTPSAPLLGEGGPKKGKNAFFATLTSFLAVLQSLQSKMNVPIRFSTKKIFKIPYFQPRAKSWPDFVAQCYLYEFCCHLISRYSRIIFRCRLTIVR